MRNLEEESEDWMAEARLSLAVAEEFLVAEMGEETVSNAFLAMVYAARSALGGCGEEISGWEDVVRLFLTESLPKLGLSKENQRSLPIVCDLFRRVGAGEVEADPVTAAACLEDARSFVEELGSRTG